MTQDRRVNAAPNAPQTASESDTWERGLPPGCVGFVEPPPPYQPGPRRRLPAWAKHLRDLRHLKLVE